MPVVSRLNVAPVRSLGLEHPDAIELRERGVLEDRRFYVTDLDNRLVDQLTAGTMVQVKAWTDPDATRLRLTFPDGTVVDDEVALREPIETPIYGRTAVGHLVDGPWAASLGDFLGKAVRIVRCDEPAGTRKKGDVSLVGDGAMDALGSVLGVGDLDARRFRMLIELRGARPHEEDEWAGCRVAIGTAVVRINGPIPRCAMTTHDPDTGERDYDTLRAIKDYRGQVDGKDLMFGMWADVVVPGTVRLGDETRVLGPAGD
jgi:uncharacterized protein